MKFKELLVRNKLKIDKILKELIRYYPKSEEFFKANILSLINKLCYMEENTEADKLVITIRKIEEDEDWRDTDEGYWYDVYAYSKDESDDETYAIEMTDWRDWLNFEVDPEILKNYKQSEIIAHCLNELTFFGADEEEMKKQREELIDLANNIDLSQCKSYDSVEDMLRDLGLDD